MANHRQPIPKWLNENYMENILKTYYSDPQLKINGMSTNPGSAEGDNYIGQIFRIEIDFKSCKVDETSISIIGKLKAVTGITEDFAKSVDLFEREVQFFNVLLPKLNAIFKKRNVTKVFIPNAVYVDSENSMILMEDLKVKNFELQPKMKYLSLKQMELVIEALACFHGASFYALKECPELINIFKNHVFNGQYSKGMADIISNSANALKDYIDNYGISEEWKKRITGIRERLDAEWFKIYEKREGKLNFLLHGDIWLNNMMFHFTNGEPDKVMLIDFQIVNYSSFANDLMHTIFSSLQSDFILTKMDYIIERYYDQLVKVAPDIPGLTLKRVKTEFYEKYYFGYLVMLLVRPIIASEKPPDFDAIISGEKHDLGFNSPLFISDVEKLLPIFEQRNIW